MKLHTEKVSQDYEPRPGKVVTREFWIAYPDHVLALGSMQDRINRSLGRGFTRAEALAAAERPELNETDTPTNAEIVNQIRRLVRELERMDRSEDYRIRNTLRDILDGREVFPA